MTLRPASDPSVFYQWSFEGYQDTLHVHSNRLFYRKCDIYERVDFIFENTIVAFFKIAILLQEILQTRSILWQLKAELNRTKPLELLFGIARSHTDASN